MDETEFKGRVLYLASLFGTFHHEADVLAALTMVAAIVLRSTHRGDNSDKEVMDFFI